MAVTQRESRADVPSKSTLFCPECGHQSRYDDDWRVVETARTARYLCPECRTEITARPTVSPRARHGTPAAPPTLWRAWSESVRLWVSLWYRPAASN